ncbi:MAG: M20/M25/M40 family metallo-hydrolase [Candidatus Beckwithbacteria bacterium]|nr:M20/M25/M40 family metallo-hydrolase [Candidatus Beckwithbacteria bacterium]
MTNLIQKLIQIKSISGSEPAIQKFIFNYLLKLGLKPAWQQGNLWVKIKGKNNTRALIFNAHVDTVTAGENKLWQFDPWAGMINKNKIIGLGASDEKAGVASLLLLAEKLVTNQPESDIWLMFVVNEEVDGSGTKKMIHWFMENNSLKYKKLAAVLVEPTSLKSVEIGHKGNVFIKLTVKGDSGHGSEPEEIKVNAVLVMSRILLKLEQLAKIWSKKYPDPILGWPTIGIGTSIIAGEPNTPNKFSDSCQATLDVRTTPSLHEKVIPEIKEFLKSFPVEISLCYPPAPFGLTDKNEAIIKALLRVKPELKLKTSSGSTDQCFFTKAKIPAVIFGPGEENQAHRPNEWCFLNKIDQAVKIYATLIQKWGKMK